MSKNTVLFALYRMGYHSRMTGHGFRALASTALNEMGYRPDVIERQLAHTEKNAVRAAYHRSQYLEERRTMMQPWAEFLDAQRARGIQGCRLQGCTRRRELTKVYHEHTEFIVQKSRIQTDHKSTEGQRVSFSRHNLKIGGCPQADGTNSSLWNWTPG